MSSSTEKFGVYFALAAVFLLFWQASFAVCQDSKMPNHWIEIEGQSGPGAGRKIVLIAGDDEYRSEEALPMLAKILAVRHGFHCSVLFPINDQGLIQPDHQTNIPGMHLLNSADLVILGLRFRNLPVDQMQHFADYIESGKPIIGLRTSTHAFRIPRDSKFARFSWEFPDAPWQGGFGKRVLGETWVAHHGKHGNQSTRGVINEENSDHPILTGVTNVWGPTDVYKVTPLDNAATVLLRGQVIDGMQPRDPPIEGAQNEPMMPLAWSRKYRTESGKEARIFCTTMGASTDFESAGLRRLFVNAAFWSLGMEKQISNDLSVQIVGEYRPTPFGFGNYRKGLKPGDYGLANQENPVRE